MTFLLTLLLVAAGPASSPTLSVDALRRQLTYSGDGVWIVDLRDEVSFDLGHLPRALNLGARDVERREFLRSRALVLVYGEANPCPALELRARLLAAEHASVQVLEGGFEAWAAAGAPVEGGGAQVPHPPALREAARAFTAMDLRELLACREVAPVVLDLGAEPSAALPPGTVHLQAASLAEVRRRWQRASTRGAWRAPLVLIAGEQSAQPLLALAGEGALVFGLQDGVPGWTRLGETRAALPVPEPCPSCGKGNP